MFPKAFVAVFGPAAGRWDLRTPVAHDLGPVRRSAGEGFQITSAGTTSPTLEVESPSAAGALFRGRPFSHTGVFSGQRLLDPAEQERALRDLDGRFSLLTVGEHSALLATDVLGAGALFWAQRGEQVFASSHLGWLLWALDEVPRIDRLGMASLLAGYCVLHGRTPYEGIQRLQSCEYLALDFPPGTPLRIRVGRYANLPDLLLTGDFDRLTSADREAMVGTLLLEGVAREPMPGGCRLGLPLSGGRDSASLALILRRLGIDFEAITCGDRDSWDVRRARVAAQRLRIRHRVIAYDQWDYGTFADRIVSFAGGSSGLIGGSVLGLYQEAAKDFSLLLSGYLGDAITGAHLPHDRPSQFTDILATILFHRGRPSLQHAFGQEIRVLEDELKQSWEGLANLPPHQAHLAIDLTQRQATYTSPVFDLGETFIEVGFPMVSRRLMQFWFNAPLGLLQRQRSYDAWRAGEMRQQRLVRPIVDHPGVIQVRERIEEGVRRRLGRPERPSLVNWANVEERSTGWLREALASCSQTLAPDLWSLCTSDVQNADPDPGNPLDIAIALPALMVLKSYTM